MKGIKARLLCSVMAISLTSCTSMRLTDFFTGYSQQLKATRIAVLNGDVQNAAKLSPRQSPGHNAYSLSLLEQARLDFLMARWPESEQLFARAYQVISDEQAKAKIQLSKGLDTLGASVSNDNAIRYQVSAYEQSMLHSYQALNYLHQREFESALVEIRRANLIQEQALSEHQQEIDSTLAELMTKGINENTLHSAYRQAGAVVSEVKNGFQNAYTFYLSGLLYEVAGELNDAYIDYKKALEIFPDNSYLQRDVWRLATLLGMHDDLKQWSFDFSEQFSQSLNKKSGELVVLYEQGLVPAKLDAKLNLPVGTRHGDMRFFNFSLPIYRDEYRQQQPLILEVGSQSFRTEPVVAIKSLAMKTLEQQMPAMVARQVIRVLAKERLRRKMKQEGGDIGNILAGIYSLASEHADTRSWQTLPDNIQILRVKLPTGVQQLTFAHANGQSSVEVDVRPGRVSLVNISTIGDFTGVHANNL